MKLDTQIRPVVEQLAREMNRRSFLRRAASLGFGSVAALASGHLARSYASANSKPLPPLDPVCAPVGPYCNLDGNIHDPNGCHGASCFEHLYQGEVLQCRVFYNYWQAGCWTNPAPGGGYWTCCDCECLRNGQRLTTCECAQYSSAPAPRPDGPGRTVTAARSRY